MILHESERLDFSKVPQSQGVPKRAYVVLVVGLLMIFFMGGYSAFSSGWQHNWPWEKNLRYDLGKMPSDLK